MNITIQIRLIITGLAVCIAVWTIPGNARGQIYVTNEGTNSIGEYNATSGTTINASLISGLNIPTGIALVGGNLFVAKQGNNTIGEYNATTGAAVNSAFLSSGLNAPTGIAVFGGNLFVVNQNINTIGEYDAVTGA